MRLLKKIILLFLVAILLININYLKKIKSLKFKNKIKESNNLSYNENKTTDSLINQTLKIDIEKSGNELNIKIKNSTYAHDWMIQHELTRAEEETTTQQIKNTNYSFPHDWNIILSPHNELCGNDSNKMLTFIAFVIIAPHQFDQRQKIRETWANRTISDKFKVFFIVGLSKNVSVNNKLKEESTLNKDILQEDFYDSYFNMTKKVMGSFKWISNYCNNSYFTLKIDSDIVVNTFKLIAYLDSLVLDNKHENKLIGNVFHGALPQRFTEGTWYVSFEEFPDKIYPDFCSGVAYLLSSKLTKNYFEFSLNFYKRKFSEYIEDVYIGMIAKELNTEIINIGGYYFPNDHYSGMGINQKERELKSRKDQTYFVTEKLNIPIIWNVFKNN